MINYRMFHVDFTKYYHPLYLIDLRFMDMFCELNNTFMFFMENPRINIDLVSGFFEFCFRTTPPDESLGQVLSKAMITYRQDDAQEQCITEMTPCIIFTRGLKILELLIYMPLQEFRYLKELQYFFYPKTEAGCVICYERGNVINIHRDEFEHCVCMECLVRINQCPLCRMPL